MWTGESKPGTTQRIRIDANIKYVVSVYQDSCGLGLSHLTAGCTVMYMYAWIELKNA